MAEIVIIGAGFGGLTAACRLSQTVKGRHTITLIDRKDTYLMGLTKLWVVLGLRQQGEGAVPISKIEGKGVKFLKAEITRIDTAKKTIETGAGPVRYDQLILAPGADTAPEAVAGLPKESNLYDPANGAALNKKLEALTQGEIAIVVCASPYKCPPAPFECALLIEAFLRARKRDKDVRATAYVPEARPMMVAGPAAGAAVQSMLEARGISVRVEHKLKAVEGRTLRFENGKSAETDLLLAIPPHRAPAFVSASGLADASGWIAVDPKTCATAAPDVHAVGDATVIKLPGGGMLPKAGVFAEAEAEIAAERVAAAADGAKSLRDFDGKAVCYMEAGDGQAIEITADFFGDPAKRVAMAPPSAASYQKKRAFETDRLKLWFA